MRAKYCCAGIVGKAAAISEVVGEDVEPTYITLQRSLKILHYRRTTKRKLNFLDNLTAKLTYAVRLWDECIEKHKLKSKSDCSAFEHEIQRISWLSSAFVQQARDKALWMWKQYREAYKSWKYELNLAKARTKWYKKLLKRESSPPLTFKRSRLKKIPTKFDSRTGVVEFASAIKISPLVARISTLKKHEKLTILLNPSKWHLDRLRDAAKICGFEIVKRSKKYFFHVLCEYLVHAQPVHAVRGVDLGVNREMASVKLPKHPRNFMLLRNNKRLRLKELNDRVSHLRRLKKWQVLKRIRNKRKNVAEDYDRKTAKKFAAKQKEEIIIVGDPQRILSHKYRGDGNKRGGKILQHWSYARLSEQIIEKLKERGIIAIKYNEWETSSECHKCGGKLKGKGRRVVCNSAG